MSPVAIFLNVPVDLKVVKCPLLIFKKWQCLLSPFMKFPCRFENSEMSPLDFKKCHCPLFSEIVLSILK